MFTHLKNVKKFTNKTLSIEELVNLVKDNPQKTLIDKIRAVEYKSNEYNRLKLQVNAIMPHGIFNGLLNKDITSFSNYLFYDIDGINNKDQLNDTINRLIDTFPISFLQKSVSNKGFHFLIKLDDTKFNLTDTNTFNNIYKYIRHLIIEEGFNIDIGASGINRKMIVSSDYSVYYNSEVSFGINMVSFNKWLNNLDNINKIKVNKNIKVGNDINPNDTTYDVIELSILVNQIKTEIKYEKEINGDFVVDDMNYYRIILPKEIRDGDKHKIYSRVINALYYINGPEITKQQIYSYLYHINNRLNQKMNLKELFRFTNYVCDNIIQTGEIRIKTKIKKLHFNKMSKLKKEEKMIMGSKLAAKIRNNKTIELIKKAKDECYSRNEVPTQNKVQKMTGLGIATIKRNWHKELNNLQDIGLPISKDENIWKETINENEFFQETKDIVKHKYKGFEECLVERSINDKEEFKSVLKQVKNEYGDILESLVIETLTKQNWDKYKIDYYYSNWEERQKITK